MRFLYLVRIFFCLLFTPLVKGLVLIDSTLASACVYYEKSFDWGCGSHGNGMKAYACRCANINWLGTITNCIHSNSNSTRLINHAYRHMATRCAQKGGFNYTLKDMQRFYENGTHYLRDPTEADKKNPVYTTLRVNQTEFKWYHKKFKDFTFSVQRSQWFGWGLVFYWATIISFATAFNINKRFIGLNLNCNWVKKHIILPSVFKQYHERTYLLLKFIPLDFPTRLHGLIVFVFIIQVIISVGVGYEMTTPHPYLSSRWIMNLDLVSYRTDMMAISLFPVIYLFGIRNNPFIPLTGISFATFNFYHKWCAYVCVALAFIHAICCTVWAINDGGYHAWYMDAYWKWGIGASVFSFLLVFHSEKFIRDIMYEVFLFFHKIMNYLFIVCMYYHCNDLGWLGWIWSMAGILCFDRFMRLVRVALSGGLQTAILTDCGQDVVRMTVKKPKLFKYYSGSFAFFYFVDLNDPFYMPWQSHPFTILTTPKENTENKDTLIVYFKAKKGITKNMLNKILRSGKESIRCKVFIEGPYGNTIPTITSEANRKFVGVSAGLGVSAVYPHYVKILESRNTSIRHSFYWVINDFSYLNWFSSELFWLQSQNCDVKIIYTGSKELEESSSLFSEDDEKMLKTLSVDRIYGRPNLMEIVSSEVGSCNAQLTDITFISCGPSAFNDTFRHNVRDCISEHTKVNINLEQESFTW